MVLKMFPPKQIQIETYSNFSLFFFLVQRHNYILFFSLFDLKDQKKFESINLRISLNLLLLLYAVCMCVQQEVTIKPIYVSLDHLIGVFS